MQELARIRIDASPEAVFELLADNTRRGEWAEGMETFDYTSDFDPDDPVGTTFTQRIREGGRITEYHGEITTYDPPKAWGSQVTGGSYSMVVEYHLTAVDGGTEVVNVCDVDSSSGSSGSWASSSAGSPGTSDASNSASSRNSSKRPDPPPTAAAG